MISNYKEGFYENPDLFKKNIAVRIINHIDGPYENYEPGDREMISQNELEKGYFIQGFKDYAYFNKDIDLEIIE